MIVRALDANGDWTFGAGRNNYKSGIAALQQNIQTRCLEVLGDCFFATDHGIDWFNLLGGREPETSVLLDLGLRSVIVNTLNVTGITSAELEVDDEGVFRPVYNVETAFSVNGIPLTVPVPTNDLITEIGDLLTTEDGTAIGV